MRFPASHRLRLQADFSRLREQGSRYNCGAFVVNAAPSSSGDASARGFVRLGVIAPKRTVSNRAVHRNYAKRVFREIFRKNPDAFPPNWDVVIIVRSAIEKIPFSRLEARYREAATRIVGRVKKAAQNRTGGGSQ